VSEWLNLMLEEIARKQREAKEAEAEVRRRKEQNADESVADQTQSK
jgi:hypothetical protein